MSFFFFGIVFICAALYTFLQVLLTLVPRVTHTRKAGLLFFGDIAVLDPSVWQQRMQLLSPQELAQEVLEQVFITASTATCKHKHVGKAIRALMVTIISGLILFLMSQFFF